MGDKDNWHLGDIESHDVDNLTTLLKGAKEHQFKTVNEVLAFSGQALNTALMKHGINLQVAEEMSKDKEEYEDIDSPLNRLMAEKRVRVEERMEYTGLDRWRCGLYVYKDNEIADFIGAPVPIESVLMTNFRYTIRTTVRL